MQGMSLSCTKAAKTGSSSELVAAVDNLLYFIRPVESDAHMCSLLQSQLLQGALTALSNLSDQLDRWSPRSTAEASCTMQHDSCCLGISRAQSQAPCSLKNTLLPG